MAYERLDEYMRAGFVPICHCRKVEAVLWVSMQCMSKAQFAEDGCHIMINIGDEEVVMWAESDYVWEDDTLFRRNR